MKYFGHIITMLIFLVGGSISAQNVSIEGYVFASNNTGYLGDVEVKASIGDTPLMTVFTDKNGQFSLSVPPEKSITLVARKQGFKEKEVTISTVGKKEEVVYSKISMDRSAGYIFEATLSELVSEDHEGPVDALTESTVEIYNNTKKKEVLVLKDHPKHIFAFTFEKGNHYTIMIRKKGFFTKRLEANVDINDCLLCFEGVGTIRPAVSDNLTVSDGHSSGVLATDIKLKRVVIGEPIEINNIYYDLAKWDLRAESLVELDKLAGILRDNPHLIVEISAHTDSRGTKENNNILSAKRAKSAMDYLILKGVDPMHLSSKGYGEGKLKNDCKDDVKCSNAEHQENRRTEFMVTGVLSSNPYEKKSLKKIIEEEQFEQMLKDLENSVVQVPEGGVPPSNDKNEEEGEGEGKTSKEKSVANDLMGGGETMTIPDEEPEIIEVPKEEPKIVEVPKEEAAKPPVIKEEPEMEPAIIEMPVKKAPELPKVPVEKPKEEPKEKMNPPKAASNIEKTAEIIVDPTIEEVEKIIPAPSVDEIDNTMDPVEEIVEEIVPINEETEEVLEEMIAPNPELEETKEDLIATEEMLEEVIATTPKEEMKEEVIEKTEKMPSKDAASFIFSGTEDTLAEKKEELKEAEVGSLLSDKLMEEPTSIEEPEELEMLTMPDRIEQVTPIAEKPEKPKKTTVEISPTQYRQPDEKEKDKIIPSAAPFSNNDEDPPSNLTAEDLAVLENLIRKPGENSDPLVNKLAKNYTGYKIEIVTTQDELPLTHDIFKEFGKLDVELNVEKRYHYLMGDFRNGNLAQTFLQRSILQRYPSARVVHYQGGQRIPFY